MRKELILFLLFVIMSCVITPSVNAEDLNQVQKTSNQVQKTANQNAFPFDNDPFFQSNDDVFTQIKTIQQAMDKIIQKQFQQINTSTLDLINSKYASGSSQEIQIEERNNELIYKIKQPKGTDSKVDVSVKNGFLIISTHLVQKTMHGDHGNKSFSYSQHDYNQSFKLPKEYDPNSIDIKRKDSNLMVTFKKQMSSSSLKT